MITTLDIRSLPGLPEGAAAQGRSGSVVSIGVFDGVHRGHQAILAANCARARALGARPTVVTFRRHPKRILLGHEPRTLTSLEHRLELFRRAGIEHTVALAFDDELRALSAEAFVSDLLVGQLGARAFVLGFDSKFGHDRRGTPERLVELGLDVTVVPAVQIDGRAVSSTAIREAVELGDLRSAARMLGRPVSVLGTVVHGARLGARLGFPTANLDLHHQLHPPAGVYATRARFVQRTEGAQPDGTLPCVTNIGYRPTLGGERPSAPQVETHLLDFAGGELYGAHLEVEFVERLRSEQAFADLSALGEQIARDCLAAREVLAAAPGARSADAAAPKAAP